MKGDRDIIDIKTATAGLTHTGRVRRQNEDNLGYARTPHGHVFTVCDGMGGHAGGREASATAVKAILEYLSAADKDDPVKLLDEALRHANRRIYEKAASDSRLQGMGTTAVIVLVQGDKVYTAHVGDSRIYLFTDGRLIQLTKDHSLVQRLYEDGIISKGEMRTHSRKNEITKALGLRPAVEPEVNPKPHLLKNGDTLLLCTDGLTDMVDDESIRRILAARPDVKEAARELVQEALDAGGKDNVTLQLIKITNSPHQKTVFHAPEDPRIHQEITLIDESFARKKQLPPPAEKSTQKRVTRIALAGLALLLLLGGLYTARNKFFASEKEIRVEVVEEEISTEPTKEQSNSAVEKTEESAQPAGGKDETGKTPDSAGKKAASPPALSRQTDNSEKTGHEKNQ